MNIDKIMGEIEDILDSAWQVPMSGGRVLVDSSEIIQALQDLRLALPKEIIQAKNIVADRAEILKNARLNCESVYKAAEEKVRSMLDQEEIVKKAKICSDEIIKEAYASAKEIKARADNYIDEIFARAENFASLGAIEIKKARKALRNTKEI